MKKKILMGSILAIFVLMMTPCIPALQVQSNESSIDKTLSQKASLLFSDNDNAKDLESTMSLVFKKLINILTAGGSRISRLWGLYFLFCTPFMLLMIPLFFLVYPVWFFVLLGAYGLEYAEKEIKELWAMMLGSIAENLYAAIYILLFGRWPDGLKYMVKFPWMR